VGLTPVLALPDITPEEREQNRRLLEKYQADPEHAARLKRDLLAFRALPPEKQDRLRQLARDLAREDPATRARLLTTLQRYNAWLATLSDSERHAVTSAPTARDRLDIIRQIRSRQWEARLPRGDRDRLAQLDKGPRLALVQQLRQHERQRREEWRIASRFWKELMHHEPLPTNPKELPAEVQEFVDKSLLPLCSGEERRQLKAAENNWPLYPRTLVELADRHPLFPGPKGPTRWSELGKKPKELKELKKNELQRLRQAEGRWPEYGVALLEVFGSQAPLAPKYIPSRPKDFSPEIQRFITQELFAVMTLEEMDRLSKSEGNWPLYPETLRDLARKHGLHVPETTLPGPRELWDRYRLHAPVKTPRFVEPPISRRDGGGLLRTE
jgi:hypothetical protein